MFYFLTFLLKKLDIYEQLVYNFGEMGGNMNVFR